MRARRIATLALLAGLVAPMLQGCNDYELFRLAGLAQEDFTNDAELLFVIDNSTSMKEESADLAVNMDGFIDRLIDPTGGGDELDGLSDAVDNYILSVSDRGSVVDFQIGITTTDVGNEYGELISFSDSQPIIPKGTADTALKFNQNLLCTATCFEDTAGGGLPNQDEVGRSDYQCGDPLGDELFFEYMNCTCGDDVWKGNCGSGTEEHIEATFLAMCRGLDPSDDSIRNQTLLEACEDEGGTPFVASQHAGTNADFFREGSTVIPIIVTDAGDNSRRLGTGEAELGDYAELFPLFGRRMAWALIAPRVEDCKTPGADSITNWQEARYDELTEGNGIYVPITEELSEDDCQVADFGVALDEVGSLLNELLTVFPLQAIPDQETILVFVDGKGIDPALEERDEDTGEITYGSGWTYLAAENAIEFHGEAVPDFSQEVRIYYRPLSGMPRTLPFASGE